MTGPDDSTGGRPSPAGIAVWGSPAWLETAVAWLDVQLAAAGIERTGEVEQPHLRPWANVLRAPTDHGPVWLKAAGSGTAAEIGLYELLARVAPGAVLAPIALDLQRAWIVLPDGGPSLGERFGKPGQHSADLVEVMLKVLPQYAQFQRDVSGEVQRMLAVGVPDMRAEVMPARFDQALAFVTDDVERRHSFADRTTIGRLGDFRDTYLSWCLRLAEAPGCASLDHNDLHPWNVLGQVDGSPARFYDWGDAVLAHPFASMLVALGVMQQYLPAHDPHLALLRDAYLDVFSDLGSHSELVATLELACRVAKVARALTWVRALRELDGEDSDFVDSPMQYLGSLLDPDHITPM